MQDLQFLDINNTIKIDLNNQIERQEDDQDSDQSKVDINNSQSKDSENNNQSELLINMFKNSFYIYAYFNISIKILNLFKSKYKFIWNMYEHIQK
ncbi:unnamed protein product [Paramecium pentaurelia]|uniref:Transmembrane protein n=1 Tax=Paramecium pentaurelia TaxID=43138 RepID=A0A8S1U602_9CILI|nr:unnamed protein product [Paramecium pentaurelia]